MSKKQGILIEPFSTRYGDNYKPVMPITEMIEIYLKIQPAKIVWLKYILEGYDGLGLLTTVNRHDGLVFITTHPSLLDDLYKLLSAIVMEIKKDQPDL